MHRDITPDNLLVALRCHIGQRRGITVTGLGREVLGCEPTRGDERAIRELVLDLRLSGHHICARPGTGYFIAETPEELEDTIEFLRHRAMSSLLQIAAMKRISIPDLWGQLKLPT